MKHCRGSCKTPFGRKFALAASIRIFHKSPKAKKLCRFAKNRIGFAIIEFAPRSEFCNSLCIFLFICATLFADIGRWITTDPAGFIDGTNLYLYVLNNPLAFSDPDGLCVFMIPLFIWGAELAIPALSACIAPVIYGAVTGAVAYGGYQLVKTLTVQGPPSVGDYYSGDLTPYNDYAIWEKTDVYAPDRPLPRDPRTKEPVPETDAPHTELGTKKGTNGKYPQAREFDAQGKPVKDIDFTNHGRPQNHPNPHEHKWKPNPTGGTPQRSTEAEPLKKIKDRNNV